MSHTPVNENKDETKEKIKGKQWKNLSSSEKDEVLWAIAVKLNLYDGLYEDP